MFIPHCQGWWEISGYLLVCVLTCTETSKQHHTVIYEAVFAINTAIIQPTFLFSFKHLKDTVFDFDIL